MKRMAVFISGGGSNLQALIDACREGKIQGEIGLVVSNQGDAYGLVRARQAAIPTLTMPLRHWKERGLSRQQFEEDLAAILTPWKVDLVVLAGWMLILGPPFLDRVRVPVINLHPALPGAFPGTHAIQRAWEAYQRGGSHITGVMVHHVIPEVDAGPVLGSQEVVILDTDDLEALEGRIHMAEHDLLVHVVADILKGEEAR